MSRTVGLRELRQDASDLVRRAQAGEEILVTVAGRPSVRLVPAAPRTWRRWSDLAAVFSGPADPDWPRDVGQLDHGIDDPWTRA